MEEQKDQELQTQHISKSEQTNTKFFKPLTIVVIIVLLITLPVIGFYVGADYQKNKDYLENKSGLLENTPTPANNNSYQPTIAEQKWDDFTQYLSENCDSNNEILLEKLPFSLSQKHIFKYNLKDKTSCVFPYLPVQSRNSGFISMNTPRVNDNLNQSALIIGTIQSSNAGVEESDFGKFNSINPTITVDEIPVVIDILSPGPYGLSSLGIWLRVKGYKQVGDYLVISEEFKEIEVKDDVLEMFMKYKDDRTPSDQIDNSPEYTANERESEFKADFINTYLLNYPDIEEPYKSMIEEAVKGANSITVK